MAVQMLGIKTKFTDDQGRPLVGGKVHAYFAGTTTYQDTFKDPDMTIVNTNPIILDDSGSADVYLNGSYRIRIFDKNDVLIEEQDGVTQSVNGEITTAKGEIIGLYGAVLNSLTNEVKRAVAAEKTIADSLTSETTRAKSAESALQSSINAETTRAKAAESDLNTGLAKEVSDRKSDVTRLDEADAVLQAQINSVGGGKLAYKTYAEMIADKSNIAAKSSIDIIADTDDKNGTYLYDGANFVKSNYDLGKIIRAKVQNTFGTYDQMVASNLSDGSYALVADDTADKNGVYIKNGSNWVKSKFDIASNSDAIKWLNSLYKNNSPEFNGLDPYAVEKGKRINSAGDISEYTYITGLFVSPVYVLPDDKQNLNIFGYSLGSIHLANLYDKYMNRLTTIKGGGEGFKSYLVPASDIPSNAKYLQYTGYSLGDSKIVPSLPLKSLGYNAFAQKIVGSVINVESTDSVSRLDAEILDAFEVGYYIKEDGTKVSASANPDLMASDFLEIDRSKSRLVFEAVGRNLVYAYCFYNSDKSLVSSYDYSSLDKPLFKSIDISDIPSDVKYIRITGMDGLTSRAVAGVKKPTLKEFIKGQLDDSPLEGLVPSLSTLMITGASLAYSGNAWFGKANEKLGTIGINKARSGVGTPKNDAPLIWSGTFMTDAEFEASDVFSFQYASQSNLDSLDGLKPTAQDYVAGFNISNPVEAFASYSEAQCLDFILKFWQQKCYEQRNNPNSKWYGTAHGKPFRLMFVTHWHDSRTNYNNAIRVVAERWGAGVCEFDKKIGFSKNSPLADGTQVSTLYSEDTAEDSGVVYGWHPKRGDAGEYIQNRLASIYAQSIVNQFGY